MTMHSGLIFIAIALIYTVAKIVLEKRLAPMDAVNFERQLSDLGYSLGCSTHKLFQEAGAVWNFSEGKIEFDFERYLSEGFIPTYVSNFVTLHSSTSDQTYQKVLFSGGRPPYL